MIIASSIIRRPRKLRICAMCRQTMLGEQMRVYGAAERGDPPYALYMHEACCSAAAGKARDALARRR